jgi:hypothetical protein
MEIVKLCGDKGLDTSKGTVYRHATHHLKGYKARRSSEIVDVTDIATDQPVNKPLQDMNLDLVPILKGLGIDQKSLEAATEIDPEEYRPTIVAALKKLTLGVVIGAISKNERHQAGEARFPIEDISALDKLIKIQDVLSARAVAPGERYDVFACDHDPRMSVRPRKKAQDPQEDELQKLESALHILKFELKRSPEVDEKIIEFEARLSSIKYRKAIEEVDQAS